MRKQIIAEDTMTTGYLEKLKAEMEGRLGCKIEIVEDRDSSYPCKIECVTTCPGRRCFPTNRHSDLYKNLV